MQSLLPLSTTTTPLTRHSAPLLLTPLTVANAAARRRSATPPSVAAAWHIMTASGRKRTKVLVDGTVGPLSENGHTRRASTRVTLKAAAVKAEPESAVDLSKTLHAQEGRGRSRKSAAKREDESAVAVKEETKHQIPSAKRGRARKESSMKEEKDVEAPNVKRKRAAAAKKDGMYAEDGVTNDDDTAYREANGDAKPAKAKKTRAKKPKEPIVYDIPDVPQRDFRLEGPEERRAERSMGYRGRLGYACLNTVLRNQDPPLFCSRNVRIKTIEEKGIEYVKELALQNVRDIIPLLEFNAANNIHMMRLSSEIFPFASHETYGYDISYAEKELKEAGAAAKRLNQRLTMHPGQFCQLGTPKKNVLDASLRELDVHAKVLDLMGVGPEGVMILHGGGTFGDREATLERIRYTIDNLLSPSVRRRLVLENDELGYSAEELLPLCESLDPPVPLVFDFHHDMLRPSSLSPAQIVARAQAIFSRRGVPPKYHLSEPRPGAMTNQARRAHSDRCMALPADLPADADLMLECKDKEQGVLEMYRIYRLFDVHHDSLRPPANDLTMSTAGRRSKLDGQGGASKPKAGRGGRSSSQSPTEDDTLGEDIDIAATTTTTSPKKERVTEHSLMERAIAKAKQVAAKRGVPYTGPRSQAEIDESKSGVMTGADVKRDMERQAEWIRAELRAGRERRPFPGSEDAQIEMSSAVAQKQPEPEAY